MKTNKIIAMFIFFVLIINWFIPNVILAKDSIIAEESNEIKLNNEIELEENTNDENNLEENTNNEDNVEEKTNKEDKLEENDDTNDFKREIDVINEENQTSENSNDITEKKVELKEMEHQDIDQEEVDEEQENKDNLEKNIITKDIEERKILNEENEEIIIDEKMAQIEYNSHIQDLGWEDDFSKIDGETSGKEGNNKRIEAIKIKLGKDKEILGDSIIRYQVHVQDYGWMNWKKDGEIAGTVGESKRIEAIKIQLENLDLNSVIYRVFVEKAGWTKWSKDGEIAGTVGEGLKIEAIQIKIVKTPKMDVNYVYNTETNTVKAILRSNKIIKQIINDSDWIISEDQLSCSKEYSINDTYLINIKDNDDIENIIELKINQIKEPVIEYKAHVQNIGWQENVSENEIAGTTGKNLRMEAIKIKIKGLEENINIKYQTHVQDIGWQDWVYNNEQSGTTGLGKRIEAVKIMLENTNNFSIEYRVHISDYGWQKWKRNGEVAGTTGLSKKIEAIQIRIVYREKENIDPEVVYRTHVQDTGWQSYVIEGLTAGTEGQSKRVEALQIDLSGVQSNAKILYRTHVQDIGWQQWVSNNSIAGTTGKSKRVEAIQIKLDGMEEYTVKYKVHMQDYGWSDWMIDGEVAGTTGKSKRIEAIQVKIVPKYYRQYIGIDVSSYNKDINWQAVKNSGIQFAMIRCGYRGYRTGKIVEDTKFKYNIKNALANGIKVGLYFYSQAISTDEGIEEANFAINLAKQYNIKYPIAIDSEMSGAETNDGRADGLNSVDRTNVLKAFCNQIKNKGYEPMVYASKNWFYNNLQVDRLSDYETWLAHYTGSANIKSNYKYNYTMWQYTSSGIVSGINGKVDMNIGYKNY